MSNDYIILIGTEDIERAGYTIRDAALSMNHAADSFEFQVRQLERILQEFGDRIESIISKENS
jgi:hypothetical protein